MNCRYTGVEGGHRKLSVDNRDKMREPMHAVAEQVSEIEERLFYTLRTLNDAKKVFTD
jgi:hypothetical protein